MMLCLRRAVLGNITLSGAVAAIRLDQKRVSSVSVAWGAEMRRSRGPEGSVGSGRNRLVKGKSSVHFPAQARSVTPR
jgi:hypothetical protein